MNIKIVTEVSAIDRKKWERFVYDHPQGNVFQSPQMYAAYCETKNYQPIVVAVFEGDSLVGILLSVVQREYGGLLGNLSARSVIWGGPLVKNNDIRILNDVFKEYEKKCKRQAIYTQIRNIGSLEWAKNHLQTMGYEYEDHLNILIDLNKSEEQLWKDIHPKRKNEIRRAFKEGTRFSVFSDVDSLKKCWPILRDVYRRARLPLPDFSLFKELINGNDMSSHLKIFAALHNGQIIGTLMALCWKDRVLDWYAGAYQEYLPKYPNDLLPWEAMLWAKKNGYETFDFGGAGKPGVPYGVRDFKLKFGGEIVNFGRFQKIHKPVIMKIALGGFKAWRFAKGLK